MKSSAEYSTSSASVRSRIERRASPYCFWICSISLAHDGPPALLALQQAANLPRALALVLGFLADDQDLEAGQAIDLELEDRVGLFGVEREPLDDLLGGVLLALRLPDDLEDLVQRIEDLLEALQDMDAFLERLELVLQPLA